METRTKQDFEKKLELSTQNWMDEKASQNPSELSQKRLNI